MTACVNKKSKRVAAVVTASLVGALSIGAPAVALAANDTSIDLQFAEGGTDGMEFVNGTINFKFSDATGNALNSSLVGTDTKGNTTVEATALPFSANAESILPAGLQPGKDEIKVTPGNDYKVALYKADEKGEPTGTPLSGNRVTAAGDYVLTVTPLTGSQYIGQTFKQFFKVVGADLPTSLTAFENGKVADTNLIYSGSALKVGFKDGSGNALTEGKDYTVKYTKSGKAVDSVVDAGDYTATLTGAGKYAGSSASTTFHVNYYGFDANSAVLVSPFKGEMPTHPTRVTYGTVGANDYVDIDPSLFTVELNQGQTLSGSGQYTATVKISDAALKSGNVKYNGSYSGTSVTLTKVDEFADLMYNGAALADSYDIFPGQTFNKDAVIASLNGVQLATNASGANGQVVCNGTVGSTPGEYKLTFTYNPDKPLSSSDNALDGKWVAASKTVTVHVWAGAVDADKDLFVYTADSNKTAITSYAKAYDGSSINAGHFFVTNKDRTVSNIGMAENGYKPNLTVKLYDAEGKEVDQILNAGEYKLKVTSDAYKLSGTTEMKITIGKVDLTSAQISKLVKWNDVAGQEYLPLDKYVVSSNALAIKSLGLKYDTGNAAASPDAEKDYKGLDLLPDNVDVVVEYNDNGTWKPVAKVEKIGSYRVSVTVGDDVASNYVLPEGKDGVTLEFTVAEKSYFSDVQPSDWFYDAVIKADKNDYMNGYGGTTAFGPNDALTRGQVAVVLFNMSGASIPQDETDAHYNTQSGWNTGFSDVDGKQYYGMAIYWAKKTGVVNGYADGSFRPDQTITREQFAGMLANYAKLVNRDETVGTVDVDEALKGFKDASSVSDWAEDAVAWAVSKDVMGNGGSINPAGTLTRAEAAAMSVNYQPNRK